MSVYVPILFSIYLLQEYKWVSTTEGSTTIQQTISQRDWWLLPRAGLLCSMLLFWLDYCWMDSGPEFACSSSSPDVIFPCAFFRQRIHIQWQYLFCSLDLVLGLGWFFLENVQHRQREYRRVQFINESIIYTLSMKSTMRTYFDNDEII